MLRVTKSIAICGAVSVVAVGVAVAIDKRPDSAGPGASSEELVAAAREAYEGSVRIRPHAPERVSVDEIYVWSKRWMTAEWDLSLHSGHGATGVKAHLMRMKELERQTVEQEKIGLASAVEVAAAKYYRIEAELMFARAGG